MDNLVDGVDNWRHTLGLIVEALPFNLKLLACGVIFLSAVQAMLWARLNPHEVHSHLAAPISRLDVLGLLWLSFLVYVAFGVSDHETHDRLDRLSRDDSPTGHDRAPNRYSSQGRETIDRMRDLAHEMFAEPELADSVFAYHCIATGLKYADRHGKKDATEIEEKKLAWYLAMAEHVIDGTPDPRSERAEFVPWTVQKISGLPEPVFRTALRLYARVFHGLGAMVARLGRAS